jgi:hypothetical protein
VVARRTRSGCRVEAGFALEGGSLPLSPDYPRLVAALASGCEVRPPGEARLDPGARALLAGSGAEKVAAASLGGAPALPLGRFLAASALLVALLEMMAVRRAERTVR